MLAGAGVGERTELFLHDGGGGVGGAQEGPLGCARRPGHAEPVTGQAPLVQSSRRAGWWGGKGPGDVPPLHSPS